MDSTTSFTYRNRRYLAVHIVVSSFEILAVTINLLGICLTARGLWLGWPVGIVAVSLYAILFYQWHLYGDTVLQCIFVILQIYGWIQWFKTRQSDLSNKIHIQKISHSVVIISFLLCVIISIAIGLILSWYTNDSIPYIDAMLTSISIFGSIFTAKKYIECWYIWIFVDILYMVLFFLKGFYLTSILYGLFTIMSFYGLSHWKKYRIN
ncbi:nicotinamide mononucleotide transporter PnuC [Zymomonas mobilis subsp. mobilis ZM4 = ATCC 31821]|uniref:Nicotinamide riboside transporter PnuC n=1 Tax=Zymomonas mobilis subsp. mobilis (strain ATCC 31821 / ZM4 / CP4) TaxID=264203 RepID=Q5NMH7_ZYMMO|nr:nicotinamide riboside transporter PnuC [Zymomonas mobilis]AAV90083.1 nicotinamide mononucleotide transporter PnuC [Zymomonas mobilis subsp. mobilis ZM4 = ATCC 31821]AVZ26306.1 nicotinamide mononucleotide transporter PnuC [Zymomonas mobilis subsp. mobilis]AVZ28193.1 nicotinamide mononucleotide transporter PnuC [Zymomonas mobilis subsp. mobilis]AVZ42638.1 nicotinamide mononucleotide transporter PnuC [Zymomonas mobilis subsp. mobilis ZM4 = ATCC 31821]UBQ07404.1 nicotinamide riboside transporte